MGVAAAVSLVKWDENVREQEIGKSCKKGWKKECLDGFQYQLSKDRGESWLPTFQRPLEAAIAGGGVYVAGGDGWGRLPGIERRIDTSIMRSVEHHPSV